MKCCVYVSVQFSCSFMSDSATPWATAHQASLSITKSWSLPKLMSIEWVTPSNHLILSCPRLLPPSIFPNIRVFSNESALCIRWPKYWSFSFNISPSNEHPGLISFKMDWLDLLTVQGTLKSLLQHYGSKASILLCSALFIVQLSHPYMTTRKTITLTRQTFVDKVMSLLFNMWFIRLPDLLTMNHSFIPRINSPWSRKIVLMCYQIWFAAIFLFYFCENGIGILIEIALNVSHSSILAWRILWTEEAGGLLSTGSHRVRHDWSDLASIHALEKEMATHCSILAWRIPGTEEPGGLPSMGLHRVGHDWSDLAAAAATMKNETSPKAYHC